MGKITPSPPVAANGRSPEDAVRRKRSYERAVAVIDTLGPSEFSPLAGVLLLQLAEHLLFTATTDEEEIAAIRTHAAATVQEAVQVGWIPPQHSKALTRLLLAAGPPAPERNPSGAATGA